MSDGMGREPAYLSSHATNRYFIPNWGNSYTIDVFEMTEGMEVFRRQEENGVFFYIILVKIYDMGALSRVKPENAVKTM